jgi:exopolysaccharide production protein ExoZ
MYLSLQAGRGIAALLVMVFHLGSIVGAEKYFNIPQIMVPYALGGSGVHFFFVLSGFVIFSAHQNDIFQPRKFLPYTLKRLIRIYPIYWLIFLTVYLTAIIVPGFEHRVPNDWIVILKSLALVPQDQAVVGGTGAPVIEVAWTLQVEMVFYFLFGILILGKSVALLAVTMLTLIYFNKEYLTDEFLIMFLFQKHSLFLFLMGIGASWVCSKRIVSIAWAKGLLIGGFGLFALVTLDWILGINVNSSGDKLYLEGVAFVAIVIGSITLEQNGRVIGGNKLLELIGAASYSLYLCHYHVILLLTKIATVIGLPSLGLFGALVVLITIAGACIGISLILHIFFEKPITSMLRRCLIRKS